MLFVNDYSHNVCAKRAGHLPSVLLSCQSQRKDAEKIHPVLRGIPIAVPSVNYLCKFTAVFTFTNLRCIFINP